MKRFKFEMGGMYVFYFGTNLGEAIREFIKYRSQYLEMIEQITEEPYEEYERP
jgi:phage FluMu gp28-like protein